MGLDTVMLTMGHAGDRDDHGGRDDHRDRDDHRYRDDHRGSGLRAAAPHSPHSAHSAARSGAA